LTANFTTINHCRFVQRAVWQDIAANAWSLGFTSDSNGRRLRIVERVDAYNKLTAILKLIQEAQEEDLDRLRCEECWVTNTTVLEWAYE
jgi:hypothetical protein